MWFAIQRAVQILQECRSCCTRLNSEEKMTKVDDHHDLVPILWCGLLWCQGDEFTFLILVSRGQTPIITHKFGGPVSYIFSLTYIRTGIRLGKSQTRRLHSIRLVPEGLLMGYEIWLLTALWLIYRYGRAAHKISKSTCICWHIKWLSCMNKSSDIFICISKLKMRFRSIY